MCFFFFFFLFFFTCVRYCSVMRNYGIRRCKVAMLLKKPFIPAVFDFVCQWCQVFPSIHTVYLRVYFKEHKQNG
uniref:Putative secreted protein n=1 Tax=Ixodes ricinus TaxID=34613 RepID=A0A6B0TUY9_IXORI